MSHHSEIDHHDYLHLHFAVSLLTILTYYFRNFLVHLLCSNIYSSGKDALISKRKARRLNPCIAWQYPNALTKRLQLSESMITFP